jgi:hypothetical protein
MPEIRVKQHHVRRLPCDRHAAPVPSARLGWCSLPGSDRVVAGNTRRMHAWDRAQLSFAPHRPVADQAANAGRKAFRDADELAWWEDAVARASTATAWRPGAGG